VRVDDVQALVSPAIGRSVRGGLGGSAPLENLCKHGLGSVQAGQLMVQRVGVEGDATIQHVFWQQGFANTQVAPKQKVLVPTTRTHKHVSHVHVLAVFDSTDSTDSSCMA
jgi:hypothetical protein